MSMCTSVKEREGIAVAARCLMCGSWKHAAVKITKNMHDYNMKFYTYGQTDGRQSDL